MAGKKINELTQATNVADSDLFIVETANGTQSVPYSSFKNNSGSGNSDGSNKYVNVNESLNKTMVGANVLAGNYSVALGTRINADKVASVAIGDNVKINNSQSVAIGTNAQSDKFAVAVGYSANVGVNSVAVGYGANAIANNSVSLGYLAKSNTSDSVTIGTNAQSDGWKSIAIGSDSKATTTTAIALGSNSKCSGSGIAIGKNAIVNYGVVKATALGDFAVVGISNSTALGTNAQTSNENSIQLGDATNLSSITAKVSITTTSDERDKTDITEIKDSALEFLNKVKAIRYVFNGRKLYIDNENLSDEEREKLNTYGMCDYDKEAHAQGTKKGSRMRVGVSAQNIQQALIDVFGDSGYANLVNDNLFDYNPDDIPDGVESQLAVNYEGFIPFLIKAVQELDARIKELENK